MKIAEIITGGLVLTGIVLRILNLPGSGVLITFPLLFLSLMYYFLSFALLNDIRFRKILSKESYNETNPKKIILAILVGFVLANLVMGVLFKLQSYPGANNLLFISLIFTGIAIVISLAAYLSIKSGFSKRVLFRSLIIGLIGLMVHFMVA